MENIISAGCKHAKGLWKGFEIQKLGEYHNLYIRNDKKLLLADIFEKHQTRNVSCHTLVFKSQQQVCERL